MIIDNLNINERLKRSGEKYILDARGYMCPYPSLMTLKALDRIEPKKQLEVLVDNPISCETIPQAVKEKGHKVISVEKNENGEYKILIIKD